MLKPAGIRRNNPGNLRPGPAWDGLAADDGSGYSSFITAAKGLRAASINLKNYGLNDGIRTLTQVANRWAPANDNNTPAQYANTLSTVSGLAVDANIDLSDKDTNKAVLRGIIVAENGYASFPDIEWYSDAEIDSAVSNALGS